MASPLVADALWSIIEPLLPAAVPRPRGGRPRVPDRAALAGILFVLRTGIHWEMLPLEVGCGSGTTCSWSEPTLAWRAAPRPLPGSEAIKPRGSWGDMLSSWP